MQIGYNTHISSKAKIIGFKLAEPNIIIGDNCYIGDDVQIICDDFQMGDYGKLHHHSNIHGNKVHIGHNAWIGQYSILDGLGGIEIGNNFATGMHSLLWSHAKFGDTLEGCRWDSLTPLTIGSDVWLSGGHTIVQPVVISDKAMTLAGAVVTRDLESNHVYAGIPARDITNEFGPQFLPVSLEDKYNKMLSYWKEFGSPSSIVICKDMIFPDYALYENITYFVVKTRKYLKTNSDEEVAFMKFLLPSKAKFIPL